jgi:iduronate 2-sulfatase
MRYSATSLALVAAIASSLQAAQTKPNILFIAVDDLRLELGCYGVKEIKSPNLDRLAASGVAFTHAYCQQAVCNPSRVSLMTGLRPDTTRVWDLVTEMRTVMPDVVTLPQHFRQHGYRAVAYGKIFHNPFPDAASWDEPTHNAQDVIAYSDANRARLAAYREKMKVAGKSEDAIQRMRGPATEQQEQPDEKNFDGKQTSDALAKMRELAAAKAPFFLAVGYIRPHLPFITPKKYWDLYDRAKIPLATNGFIPLGAPAVAFGDRSLGGFYELRGYLDHADAPSPFDRPLTEAQQRELKHGYYASVSFIDAQVGRLLDGLDLLGLAQNTIVVLWGDHGWKLGEHGGWCKQTVFEIDTRAPLMIRAPGAKANGRQSHALVEFVDIYPTLCELAALPVPTTLEGKSLVPLLSRDDAKVKDAAFSQFPRKHEGRDYMGYAMRTERYRYVEWLDATSGRIAALELYDHATDAAENENIAAHPENVTLLKQLGEQMWKTLPRPKLPYPFAKGATAAGSGGTGLTLDWHPANSKPVPPSNPTGEHLNVTFINTRPDLAELIWLGPDGSRKSYSTLAQNATFSIRTRPGAVWLVRDAKEQTLGHFVVEGKSSNGAKAVIPASADGAKAPNGFGNRATRAIEGWTVHIRSELLEQEAAVTARALKLLEAQLKEIVRVVPSKAVAELQKMPLYISPPYTGFGEKAEYHPSINWLLANQRDPAMARAVEFTNIRKFDAEVRRMPVFVLHELAHAYHDRVLGNDHAGIKTAHENAKASDKYDRVERQDSEGRKRLDRAYALTNPQEYFAECSEAFFGHNDFFPYTREQLKAHDPEMFSLLAKLWGAPITN